MIGKVYKLSSDTCDKVYIGSTHSKYPSVRMAHHRQNHRRGWRDYHGLFDKGDPKLEILEEIQLDSHDEIYKLRKLEREWVEKYDNCMNLRISYLSPEEKKEMRDKSINKYHKSPLGKLATRKSQLNTKIKKWNQNPNAYQKEIKQAQEEIQKICDAQNDLRAELSTFSYASMGA